MTARQTLDDSRTSPPAHGASNPGTGCKDAPVAEKLGSILPWLEEHKAQDVVCIDLAGQGDFADALVVAGATSMRHAQSLADGVAALCHERGFAFSSVEGYSAAQWILVDLNDIVVNIFLGPQRELYRLEELWGGHTPRAAGMDSAGDRNA